MTVPDATATVAAAVEATATAAFFTSTPLPTATPTLTVTEAVSSTTPTSTVFFTLTSTPHVMIEGEFLERYKAMLDTLREEAGLSEADYRRTIEANLLHSKLQDLFASRVPTTEEQVHARHILVETEEEAMRKGATEYLQKPFELSYLETLIRQAFDVDVIPTPPVEEPVIEDLISHVLPMSQVQEALELSASHQCAKIILKPWE